MEDLAEQIAELEAESQELYAQYTSLSVEYAKLPEYDKIERGRVLQERSVIYDRWKAVQAELKRLR